MGQNKDRWFKVYIKKIPGLSNSNDFVETERIVPLSFRLSPRGLGTAAFKVLTANSIFDNNEYNLDPVTDIYGREIMIVDNRGQDSGDDQLLNKILWKGEIRSFSLDEFEDSNDKLGYCVADEFGAALAKIPIRYSKELPNFNPFYDDIQYGNYDSLNFRNDKFPVRLGPGVKWKIYDENGNILDVDTEEYKEILEERVWNRHKIIQYLVNAVQKVVEIVWPWDLKSELIDSLLRSTKEYNAKIASSEEELSELNRLAENRAANDKKELLDKYEWFFTYELPEIRNYEGESLIDALIDLLPDPFDFHFRYNDTEAGATLVIVNKSPVDLPGVCPQGNVYDYRIPSGDTEVVNFNIRQEDIYDKVIVRGKPILWAGTLTFWEPFSGANDSVLGPDWTLQEELNWLNGSYEGIDSSLDSATTAQVIRRVLDNVFQKFKWIDDKPMIGSRSGNFGNNDKKGGYKRYFFGDFRGFDYDEYGNENVKRDEPYITFTTDRTPNKLAMTWEPFLPFTRYDDTPYIVDKIRYSLERDRFAEPFLVSVSWRGMEPGLGMQYFVDRSEPFGFASSVQISPYENGFWIRRENPQTDLATDEGLFNLSLDPSYKPNFIVPAKDLIDIQNLPFNVASGIDPNSENPNEGASNWQRFMLTVAGRSSQRIECSKRRQAFTVNGSEIGIGPVEAEKVKVIEVPAEIWIAHPNTVRNVTVLKNTSARPWTGNPDDLEYSEGNRDNIANGINRFYPNKSTESNPFGAHILRDDRDIMLQYLECYSNWLMEIRGEMNLVLAADKPWDLSIGTLIGTAKDGNKEYKVNSAVTSIEVIIEGGPPRVHINTNVPNIPLIARAIEEAHSARGIRPDIKPSSAPPTIRRSS